MFKIIILLAIYIAACYGAPGTYCGETPDNLFRCLTAPVLTSHEASEKCKSTDPGCDRIKCLFRESQWLDGDTVDKVKFGLFLSDFAKRHPDWSTTVNHAKTECLGEPLKPQGIYLNCPIYDITQCVFTSFIRYADPSHWSTDKICANARAYASICPVCPSDCYAPSIPIGSCNACTWRPN